MTFEDIQGALRATSPDSLASVRCNGIPTGIPAHPVQALLVEGDYRAPAFPSALPILAAATEDSGVLVFQVRAPGTGDSVGRPFSAWLAELDQMGWLSRAAFVDPDRLLIAAARKTGRRLLESLPMTGSVETGDIRLLWRVPGQILHLINTAGSVEFQLEIKSPFPLALRPGRKEAEIWPIEPGRWRVRLPVGGCDIALEGLTETDAAAPLPLISSVKPVELDLHHLSPDLFRRHRQAADLILEQLGASGKRILDLGGGNCILAQLLPGHSVDVVDRTSIDHPSARLCDWRDVPAGYDAVVSLDVMEHIPPDARPAFLEHLSRCADLVVLAAPFAAAEVFRAEQALSLMLAMLSPRPHDFLDEHARLGLPDLGATINALSALGRHTTVLPGQGVGQWLTNTALSLLAEQAPFHRGLTEMFARQENADLGIEHPSYRHFLVSRRETAPECHLASEVFPTGGIENVIAQLSRLLPLAALTGGADVKAMAALRSENERLHASTTLILDENKRLIEGWTNMFQDRARLKKALNEAEERLARFEQKQP